MAGGPRNNVDETAANGSFRDANLMRTWFLGLRGKQEIGDNLYAVFNLQTQFNPASGMSGNGVGAAEQRFGLRPNPNELLRLLVEGRADVQQRGLFRHPSRPDRS